MKYQIFRGMALCLALLLLMPLLPIAAADAGAQTDVILLLRTGKTLGEQAGERGMSTDDFALTPAGEEARQAADAVLDAVSAHAAHLCRDYTETARFAAALLGLAVRVDARDLPALRRAGDTGAAGVEFDVLSPAYYEALGDVLLPGGDLMASTLVAAFEQPFDAMAKTVARCGAGLAIQAGLDEVQRTGHNGALEKARDNYLIDLVRKGKYGMEDLRPILGYLIAREQEAKCIRLIVTAKRNGLEESVITERLRELYG